jgi:hypothetical protein
MDPSPDGIDDLSPPDGPNHPLPDDIGGPKTMLAWT